MTQKDMFAPNEIIADVVQKVEDEIADVNYSYSLPSGYLRTVLALHLPRFSKERLYLDKGVVCRDVVVSEIKRLAEWLQCRIESLPSSFRKVVQANDSGSKVIRENEEIYEVNAMGQQEKLYFGKVEPEVGELIQEKVHYIGCVREDTLFQYGLFRQGQEFPFAYAAFSQLNRKYLLRALPFKSEMEKSIVLTRLFNVNNAPRNCLSLLLRLSIRDFKSRVEGVNYETVLTAVNPNVFFTGSVFKASNFYPFASVVFEPLYSEGNYITRRSCRQKFGTEDWGTLLSTHGLTTSQVLCLPTVWMGYGIECQYAEQFESNNEFRSVPSEKYRGG